MLCLIAISAIETELSSIKTESFASSDRPARESLSGETAAQRNVTVSKSTRIQ